MSKIKFLSALLAFCIMLSCFFSCSGKDKIVMQLGEISVDEDISLDGNGFTAVNNYINEGLYRYYYLQNKANFLSYCADLERYYGFNVTGDKKIPIGDTEEFWSCELEEGLTIAQYVLDEVNNTFKVILALEAAAEDYGYQLPKDYNKNFEKCIAQEITSSGNPYVANDSTLLDENGKLFAWAENRWTMNLAGEGIDRDDWERINYLYQVISSDIVKQFSEKGVIKAEADDVLKQNATDDFMKNSIKYKYIKYFLKSEEAVIPVPEESSDDAVSSEDVSIDESLEDVSEEISAESSEGNSEESMEESSEDVTEQITGKEFNERLKADCQEIYDGLLNGTLNFDEEIKKSDVPNLAESNPDGVISAFSTFEQEFGESGKELKAGDIKMYVYNGAIHIIQVQELKTTDYVIDDNVLKGLRENSVNNAFKELLEKYVDAVVCEDDMLSKYLKPWELN